MVAGFDRPNGFIDGGGTPRLVVRERHVQNDHDSDVTAWRLRPARRHQIHCAHDRIDAAKGILTEAIGENLAGAGIHTRP
jgi:hypothetical protein